METRQEKAKDAEEERKRKRKEERKRKRRRSEHCKQDATLAEGSPWTPGSSSDSGAVAAA